MIITAIPISIQRQIGCKRDEVVVHGKCYYPKQSKQYHLLINMQKVTASFFQAFFFYIGSLCCIFNISVSIARRGDIRNMLSKIARLVAFVSRCSYVSPLFRNYEQVPRTRLEVFALCTAHISYLRLHG